MGEQGERFDTFTERARKVLSLAHEEAARFNHNYIGTEHLLLGLVREENGVAARVLSNMGVRLQTVRAAVEFIIGRGERRIDDEIGLTPRARRVIELAFDEARRLGHQYIGTEHLLLGLALEGDGIAAGMLESLGVSLEKARAQVLQIVNQGGGHDVSPRQIDSVRTLPQPPDDMRQVLKRIRDLANAALSDDELEAVETVMAIEDELGFLTPTMGSVQEIREEIEQHPQNWQFYSPRTEGHGAERSERYDKFTERARKVLSLAHQEAARLNHTTIGTEHLMLGLVREGDGVAARVLRDFRLDLRSLRVDVEERRPRRDGPPQGVTGLTPLARKAIELAFDEARRQQHHYIGTEHLLLGVARMNEGIAIDILQSRGIDLESVPRSVLGVINQGTSFSNTTRFGFSVQFQRGRSQSAAPVPGRTPEAQAVLDAADDEAARAGGGAVRCIDLLIALAEGSGDVGAEALRAAGIADAQAVRDALTAEGESAPEPSAEWDEQSGLDPSATSALQLAYEEAFARGEAEIAPEHLLLGVLDEAEPHAMRALSALGVRPGALRATLFALMARRE